MKYVMGSGRRGETKINIERKNLFRKPRMFEATIVITAVNPFTAE